MNYLRRLIFDHPWIGRHLATGFTGPRLGAAFLLASVTLFAAYLLVFSWFVYAGELESGDSAGSLLYFWHFTLLYALLAVLLPLKISGHIEGPRLGRAFDQLVVTGASPWRLYLGNWFIGMLYAALILLASLPYAACATIFGGLSAAQLAGAYGILLLYSNVILAVTLALSLVEREWVMAPIAILTFLMLGGLSLIPERELLEWFPPHAAEITPVRCFFRQAMPFDFPSYAGVFDDPMFFTTAFPLKLYPYFLWGLVILLSAVFLLIGPAHRFQPGLNNFGAALLPGDRRRRFSRMLRSGLGRRVELAFFYENRPRWCAAWEFPLRLSIASLPLVLFWGGVLGADYGATPQLTTNYFFADSVLMETIFLNLAGLGAWILLQADPAYKAFWTERIGRWRFPRELGLAGGFLLLLGLLFLAHWKIFDLSILNSTADQAKQIAFYQEYQEDWWTFLPALCALSWNAFLLSRALSRIASSAAFARIASALAWFGLLYLGPAMTLQMVFKGILPAWLKPFGALAPAVLSDSPLNIWSRRDCLESYYISHGGLSALLLFLIAFSYWWKRRRWKASQPRFQVLPAVAAAMLLAPLLWLAPPARAGAQETAPESDSPLEIKAAARGFDGAVFDVRANFYTVILRNRGRKALSGEYFVRFEQHESQHRPFEIGPQTTLAIRWQPAADEWNKDFFDEFRPSRMVFKFEGKELATEERFLDRKLHFQSKNPAYLLVGRKESFLTEWIQAALGGDASNLVSCEALYLPENPLHYRGAGAVFIGGDDYSAQWSEKQAGALYRYLLWGGTVILYGGLEKSPLARLGPWRDLLRPAASRSLEAAGRRWQIEELEEGKNFLDIQLQEGGPSAHLLSLRRLGPGHLGCLNFDLGAPRLPDLLLRSQKFWSDFAQAIPPSSEPFLGWSPPWAGDHLRDFGSMLELAAYFLAYTLVLGGGLFLFFRGRKRRRLMGLVTIAIVAAFLAGIPLLNEALHRRPSLAEYHEVAYFGPGSRRGSILGHLRARSSGRQRHGLAVEGTALGFLPIHEHADSDFFPPSWRDEIGPGFAALPAAGVRDGEPSRLELAMAPWAGRRFVLLGAGSMDEAISGAAILDRKAGKLEYRARLQGPFLDGELYLVTFHLSGGDAIYTGPLPAAGADGRVEGAIKVQPALDASAEINGGRSPLGVRVGSISTATADFSISLGPSKQPRFFIACRPAEKSWRGLALSSPDLAFEREVIFEPPPPSSTASTPPSRRRQSGPPFPVVERSGKKYRIFQHRLLLQELPLEVW
ncbi:MAG: hypothetical protein HY717_12560 [Planctomycetes bacterium]|nr:hypothetical protein [Planctomycetota bacterium]